MGWKDDLPTCKVCGDVVPYGKTLCWCCEHGPKLHVDGSETKEKPHKKSSLSRKSGDYDERER